MNYSTLYDIVQEGYGNWWLQGIAALLIIVGVVMIAPAKGGKRRKGMRDNSGPVWLLVAGAVIGAVSILNYLSYARLRDVARSGSYEVTEGRVEGFSPGTGGEKRESFTVSGVGFTYSRYDLTGGFNEPGRARGAIKDGAQVRISHTEGKILRLEVAR